MCYILELGLFQRDFIPISYDLCNTSLPWLSRILQMDWTSRHPEKQNLTEYFNQRKKEKWWICPATDRKSPMESTKKRRNCFNTGRVLAKWADTSILLVNQNSASHREQSQYIYKKTKKPSTNCRDCALHKSTRKTKEFSPGPQELILSLHQLHHSFLKARQMLANNHRRKSLHLFLGRTPNMFSPAPRYIEAWTEFKWDWIQENIEGPQWVA